MSFNVNTTVAELRAQMEASYRSATGPYQRRFLFDEVQGAVRAEAFVSLMDNPTDASQAWCTNSTLRWKGRRGSRVLDIGCGVGGVASYIEPEFHSKFVGVEISETACERARATYPGATYVCAAAEEFRTDEKFDLVVAIEAIEHWTNVPPILAAMRDALSPEGYCLISTPNADSLHLRMADKLGIPRFTCCNEHIHEFGFDELTEVMARAGFEPVAAKGVLLLPYWGLERDFGHKARALSDNDPAMLQMLVDLGRTCDPKYAFGQVRTFRLAR